MSKVVIYAVRVIAALLVVGTVGSIEIDRIDMWTGFCQAMPSNARHYALGTHWILD